ncbi:hypothetical protein GII36_02430 [Candidatus Mycosynbacter amalyticus]|uniref:Uncharacterized protein n=1 Tax=Candidatus Mycosynbacter amalyticus TaxID=2665156 RepID=A0A857MM89_9BACT|nr:hypothetical protein [Candidatus Mycosynbacter amalyticus]QHN42702.1 hypothetical protein GII36_02430 [Candidatus Mycosynbacter amalyticus]
MSHDNVLRFPTRSPDTQPNVEAPYGKLPEGHLAARALQLIDARLQHQPPYTPTLTAKLQELRLLITEEADRIAPEDCLDFPELEPYVLTQLARRTRDILAQPHSAAAVRLVFHNKNIFTQWPDSE